MGGKAEARLKDSRDTWKKKAREKESQKKNYKKRITEVSSSRDAWKQKYLSLKRQSIVAGKSYEKVTHHTYDSGIIWLSVWMQLIGKCSFRSCRHVIIALGLYLDVTLRIPSASSIRMWTCKYGYYEYHKEKDEQITWAIIADESVSIGQERLLLILGVNLNEWKFDRALFSSDVEVLGLEIATSWTSITISQKISQLKEKHNISYSLSDEGNNLQGAWKMQNMFTINDCTHLWAKSLERVYQDDTDFINFMQSVASLRKRWILSKSSHLLPAAIRVKSRFHQVFEYITWSESIKIVWDKLSEQEQKELQFIQQNQLFLQGLSTIKQLVERLNNIFKIKGLSWQTIQESLNLLGENLPDLAQVEQFKKLVVGFLTHHKAKIEANKTYLCCSDIIESTFGRYKQTIAKNNKNITELVLALAGLGKKFTPPQIKKAMEDVKIKDIQRWKKENTTRSLAKIKRDFFPKKRGNK